MTLFGGASLRVVEAMLGITSTCFTRSAFGCGVGLRVCSDHTFCVPFRVCFKGGLLTSWVDVAPGPAFSFVQIVPSADTDSYLTGRGTLDKFCAFPFFHQGQVHSFINRFLFFCCDCWDGIVHKWWWFRRRNPFADWVCMAWRDFYRGLFYCSTVCTCALPRLRGVS